MQMDFHEALAAPEDEADDASDRTADDPSDEATARRLERTGRFRVLRQLRHRPVRTEVRPVGDRRLGVIVDTETTGLDAARCEVIEVGAVAFTYDDAGIHDVVGVFESLQQPVRPLPAQISRLTGLTDAQLRGLTIDRSALTAFVEPADLVVAHNAAFDRPFCERLSPAFSNRRWACSATDADWKALGADGAKLAHLLADVGLFHGAHRALGDCFAVLEVLTAPKWSGPDGAFASLVAAANVDAYEIRAERTPYDMRGVLKEQGYRWSPGTDGRPKCWLKVVGQAALGSETHWLRHEIYRDEALPVVRRIAATDRFR